MIKKQFMTLLALGSLCFVGCGDSNKKSYLSPTEDNIELEVTLEQNTSSRYPLDIIFKLTNLSDKTVYYDNLAVPFNTISTNIFTVIEDGVALRYQGIIYTLYGTSFDSLAPGETFTAPVALDKIYAVTKGTHHYQVSYYNTILAKTSDGKVEVFDDPNDTGIPLKPDELAPKDHTSREVNVTSNTLEFEANIKKVREPDEY